MQQKHTIALIKDTIGHPLKRVIKELGCPMLPMELLTTEQGAFLHSQIGDLPDEHSDLNRLLSKNALAGKVVQVGNTPDGSSLFTVQVPMKNETVVLTLEYYRDEWKLRAIESVRTRRKQLRQTLVGAFFGAVITAAVCLTAWGVSSSHDPVAEAKKAGYIVLTQAQYQEQVPAAAGQQTKKPTGDAAKTGTTTTATTTASTDGTTTTGTSTDSSSTDQGQSLTFTLQQGMTTSDLTSWLKNNGLIQDQASFNQQLTQQGIDTKLRPKDYVFNKGMSEQDILNVLKN